MAFQRGSSGELVKAWQEFLLRTYIDGDPVLSREDYNTRPGFFGPNTEEATKLFQASVGLEPDGMVGSDTITAALVYIENTPTNFAIEKRPALEPYSGNDFKQLPMLAFLNPQKDAMEYYIPVPEDSGVVGRWTMAKNTGYPIVSGHLSDEFAPGQYPVSGQPFTVPYAQMQPRSSFAPTRPVITLDPGHGIDAPGLTKVDPGVIRTIDGVRYSEAELAYAMTLDLAERFRAQGFHVIITRDDSGATAPDRLAFRAQAAADAGSDIFLSIHLNATREKVTTSPTATGARAFTAMGSAGNVAGFQFELSQALGDTLPDSDVPARRPQRLGVLSPNILGNMPASLIEAGFLNNPDDFKYLKYAVLPANASDPHYQRYNSMLDAIVETSVTHYRSNIQGKAAGIDIQATLRGLVSNGRQAEEALRPFYTVQPGDAVGPIAELFGLDRTRLEELNNIEYFENEAGKTISSLAPGAPLLIPAQWYRYEIQQGDSVERITQRFGVTREALEAANQDVNFNALRADQGEIWIPRTFDRFKQSNEMGMYAILRNLPEGVDEELFKALNGIEHITDSTPLGSEQAFLIPDLNADGVEDVYTVDNLPTPIAPSEKGEREI